MPSEYPEDDSRTVPFQATPAESSARRASEVKTRYVDVPQAPERAAGPRNLAWGIIFLVGAFCAFWFANIISGRNAARSLIACLGTFGLVWLFYNLRVLRQRNGIFLALSAILLFGSALPLVESGFTNLDRLARERLGEEQTTQKLDVAPPPPMTAKNAPPAPVAPELEPEVNETEKAPAKGVTKSAPKEEVVRELMVPPPPATASNVIEIMEDSEVEIGGKQFLVKKGQTYEFVAMKDGKTVFKAGSDTASIDSDAARLRVSFQKFFESAQKEATRLYPGIGEKFSEQNEKFVEASKELRATVPDYFQSPEWPLRLARDLAAANGWKSTDELLKEANARAEAAPAETQPAAEPNSAPIAPEIPQENPLPPIPAEN